MEKHRKIIQTFAPLSLDEEKHVYFLDNKPLKTSVSTKIKKFYKSFDAESKAKEIASYTGKLKRGTSKYAGLSKKEILDMWEKKKVNSCKEGTEDHNFAERYVLKGRRLEPKTNKQKAIKKFIDGLPLHIKIVTPEIKMWHFEGMYCGTADLLLYNAMSGNYIIADYKTNIDLFKNFKGQKMLKPFENKLDTPFSHYEIQLNYYQIMLEQIKDVKVERRIIVWLLPDATYKMYDTENLTKSLKNVA